MFSGACASKKDTLCIKMQYVLWDALIKTTQTDCSFPPPFHTRLRKYSFGHCTSILTGPWMNGIFFHCLQPSDKRQVFQQLFSCPGKRDNKAPDLFQMPALKDSEGVQLAVSYPFSKGGSCVNSSWCINSFRRMRLCSSSFCALMWKADKPQSSCVSLWLAWQMLPLSAGSS